MAERPILFNAAMVRAILDGRKTQTRRIIKPQPAPWRHGEGGIGPECCISAVVIEGEPPRLALGRVLTNQVVTRWRPGDTLWVRETWAPNALTFGQTALYKADGHIVVNADDSGRSPWRPSIHMPRWASRITLRVTAVRVERLQEINEADAVAEGVLQGFGGREPPLTYCHRDGFRNVWDQIYPRSPWGANPWVSVTTFERIEA